MKKTQSEHSFPGTEDDLTSSLLVEKICYDNGQNYNQSGYSTDQRILSENVGNTCYCVCRCVVFCCGSGKVTLQIRENKQVNYAENGRKSKPSYDGKDQIKRPRLTFSSTSTLFLWHKNSCHTAVFKILWHKQNRSSV